LVGVEQSRALPLVALERSIQALELCADEFVLVGGGAGDQRALGGDQLPGVKQRLADLTEDVLIQFVGANVALGTATLGRAGA